MALRIFCSSLFATLIALSGCTDNSSYSAQSTGPDNVSDGGGRLVSPTPGGDRIVPVDKQDVDGDSGSNGRQIVPPADTLDDPDLPEPVPEPGTILLFGVGITGLAFYRRKRRPGTTAAGV